MQNKPYLLQRASFENQTTREGIDSILHFDYMGSSEFEFGALHKSLTRIRARLNEYRLSGVAVPADGKSVEFVKNAMGDKLMVLARTEDHYDMPDIINNLRHDHTHLKEWSGFKDWFKPEANIPGLAFIKRKMKRLQTRHGYRTYANENMTIRYRVCTETGKIELEGALGLKFNLWWDISNDWMMFFGTPTQVNQLMEKIGFVMDRA